MWNLTPGCTRRMQLRAAPCSRRALPLVSPRRTKEAVAALLIAFFPHYPAHSSDNQHHLQALRHLYTLATEARTLTAVDVDSRLPVHVPLKLTLTEDGGKTSQQLHVVAPCSLPCALQNVTAIEVQGGRHYPVLLTPRWAGQPCRGLLSFRSHRCLFAILPKLSAPSPPTLQLQSGAQGLADGVHDNLRAAKAGSAQLH